MEIKHLRLVKAICEEGSISSASKTLFVTSSALSHQLSNLESSLGCSIFTRSKNKWTLTKEGDVIYNLALKTIQQIDNALSLVKEHQMGSAGKIRLSTECYSFYLGLPSFIEEMKLSHPNITISLQLEATHKPIKKLLNNELDIAFTSNNPANKELVATPIFNDTINALIHKDHSLAKKSFLTAEDFKDIHLIIHSYPLDTVSIYEQFLKPNHITPKKISAVPLTEVTLEMINANVGISCFPKWSLKSFKLPKDLIFKPLEKDGLQRTHYLVTRKIDLNKKYINDFKTQFINKFQQNTP